MCSRGHWRPAEDEKLRELVERYGPHNWNAIAQNLHGRSGEHHHHTKSCRLRWFNQLDPRINRSPFTEEEEKRLLACHRIHGNRWAIYCSPLSWPDRQCCQEPLACHHGPKVQRKVEIAHKTGLFAQPAAVILNDFKASQQR
ncbi:Transcription factor [Sesamum angolense]|uniref:Transcription factor n=1 Tax=Sesamum angolense TaxID=2727404 RepID=A0AAE1X0M2_9LAMI|nr:Transcription factor [Sesamum angolense]